MYCKNCGKELIPGAAVCTQCGVAIGNGSAYCHNCGNQTIPGAAVCTNCGAAIGKPVVAGEQKSKLVAGLLAIFIGIPWNTQFLSRIHKESCYPVACMPYRRYHYLRNCLSGN